VRTLEPDAKLVDDGFVVLPGVLTGAEVARLRSEVNVVLDDKGITKHGSSTLPNAAAEAPTLSWIFCHDRILRLLRQKTGLDELVFTAEADIHRNFLLGIWHKDTGEAKMEGGYFGCDPTLSNECRVYKVALYLQDHTDGTGLTVRPGSTTTLSLTDGEEYGVPIRAGDAVLFDVRITHRGMMPTVGDRAITRLGDLLPTSMRDTLPANVRRWKYRLLRSPERLAVYFAFGAPNEMSEAFADRNMRRQLAQLGTQRFELPLELQDLYKKSNVRVANISRTGSL
jgi:hypothetical protein